MILRKPDYYKEFHCIASECKHTCCASWEIDVDTKTYNYYCKVEGEFGDQLRKWIKKEKHTHFKMLHGYCPFLSKDHLCEVYQHLGEKSLCEICTEYPRSAEVYGDTKEMTLGLSCEEVGRILFSKKSIIQFEDTVLEKESDSCADVESTLDVAATLEEKSDGMEKQKQIEKARDYCIQLLQNREIPILMRLKRYLLFAQNVQECLDEKKIQRIEAIIGDSQREKQEVVDSIPDYERLHTLFQKRTDVMLEMEVMEEEWEQLMNNVSRAFHSDSQETNYQKTAQQFQAYYQEHEYEFEHLMVYFSYRYLRKSNKDDKFLDRAKFCILCYLTILDIDRMKFLLQGFQFTMDDQIETLRIFSKQIEHSQKSLEYLEAKIPKEAIFSVDALLEQIIG